MTATASGAPASDPAAGKVAAAANHAFQAQDDAELVVDLAEETEQAAREAANRSRAAADELQRVAAAEAESEAVRAASAARAAAAAVQGEAVAHARAVAEAALHALEELAAALPAGADFDVARVAARVVAASVTAERNAQKKATARAADTVEVAVNTAADRLAGNARSAAAAARDLATTTADRDELIVELAQDTATAARQTVRSTSQTASLNSRLRVLEALQDSEELFVETFEHSPIGMLLVSLAPGDAGSVLRANPAFEALTGRDRQDLVGRWAPDLFPFVRLPDGTAIEPGTGVIGPTRGTCSADGAEERWVEVTGHRHVARGSRRPLALLQVQDVTRLCRDEQLVSRRRTRLRVAFEEAGTGMVFTDLFGRVSTANTAVARFLGRTPDELAELRLPALLPEIDQPSLSAAIAGLVAGDADSYQGEHWFARPGAQPIRGELTGSVVSDVEGHADYLVFQVHDLSERLDAQSRLAHQALHDELTGLPNRALLHDHLEQARARALRSGRCLAVLFLDLDDFKDVNDSLGHDAGDTVLVEVAARVLGCLRDSDTAARLGGDEFVIVCGDLADAGGASLVAERLDAALEPPILVAGSPLRIAASIGIAVDDGSLAGPDLLRNADTAMYRAKAGGKHRHELFLPAMLQNAVRNVHMARELQVALDDGELRLHYQPIYQARTGRLTGVEALLRWEHPTRGLLHPADFLDVAEARRLMAPIGSWVLSAALEQATCWRATYQDGAPRLWINISGDQLGDGALPGALAGALTSSSLSGSGVGMEITERHLIDRGEAVREDLLALRGMGVRVAVDDFGTGFASLEYLRRFPLDEIKIDQSFVSGLGSDRTDTAITTSIIALGHSLDLDVVAEGVETRSQYDRLVELGCDLVQGFLLQRPARPELIDRLLASPAREPGAVELRS